jgi:hypothetical protein
MMNNWLDDVKIKLLKKNQLLFSRKSACLQELLELIRKQNHRTLVMWVFICVEEPLKILKENYPDEKRPEDAIRLCKEWAKGKVKMPIAKKALLQVHTMAKEIKNPVHIALCHAVGQACAAVHVETHAIGLPIYELGAIVKQYGINNCQNTIENKIKYYIETLNYCEKNIDNDRDNWADFLLDDSRPNKEKLLLNKLKKK